MVAMSGYGRRPARENGEHAAVDINDLSVDESRCVGRPGTTASPTRSVRPHRPAGVRPLTQAEKVSSATRAWVSSVSKYRDQWR